MLQGPQTRSDSLCEWEALSCKGSVQRGSLDWEEHGNQGKAHPFAVVGSFIFGQVVFGVPLVQKAIYNPVVLANGAWPGLELKADVESRVAGCLDENKLGECQDMLVFPELQVSEL